jgi:hypothetical protein
LLSAVLALASLHAGQARAIFFDFSDTQVVNFATFERNGVRFTANPAGFASYGAGFWSGADFVQGAALQVDPGASVTLEFSQPMTFVQFGAAIGDQAQLADLASIQVFGSNNIEVFPVSVESPPFGGLGDAERRFTYLGSNLTRAVFSYSFIGQSVLAIDNLTLTPVPEPGTWALLLAGGALLLLRRARRPARG